MIQTISIEIAAALGATLIIDGWRRLRRTLITFDKALESINAFTVAWRNATRLEDVIREDSHRFSVIMTQLGTMERKTDWQPLERYIHDMRHDLNNHYVKIDFLIKQLMPKDKDDTDGH